ncbi:ABC transporter ATP-binding protein [Erwiniaceae bacterium BAC15a-03b]|uniref:Glutathione import ATP-binding protein GsiA n=1 Tax=Winslowiella arboricola TaxID=2978220 RepID=A0A9J6PVE2_9GAMM|nr:ABC transporter ATP-binding protein [Winslowiella arboricola]MCU5775669.1 ABC transporter ATP-binding protein [Winslowiella arboricola]MCU5779480.1 ABC transporter ATP-binding protein [Winslowiella arboricola]
MTSPVLDVRHLESEFLSAGVWRPVVRDLSFAIMPGETLALVGESGSGKSVTAYSIMQLLPRGQSRISGEINFRGAALLSLTSRQMQQVRGREIGMIFQEPMSSLNPVLTIGTQITEVLRKHRAMDQAAAQAEAIRLLDRVQIPAAASRLKAYPHSFSGGMRQRVVIAIALACQPALLIADEPTTALDVTVQAEILQLIKTLQQEDGMAALFITHDMGVVAEVADRTLVMYQGQAVEMADTVSLFQRPQHPYTQRLLASVPRLGDMADSRLPQLFSIGEATAETAPPLADTVRRGKPVLSVRNLVQRFPQRSGLLRRIKGHVHAVEQVSFDIQPGETLALVGESGCGKSTLARAIMRLTQPTSGEVWLNQTDMLAADSQQLGQLRRQIQLIFQDPGDSLNPRLRIGSALAEPMIAHGLITSEQAAEAVAGLLKSVGLEPAMADRYPHQFSGGQRQRISIARALALNPSVLIADESVSALDVTVRAEIINLLMRLQQEKGISILFISHDLAVVERISHRVAVMYQGKIVEIGPRQAVFAMAGHPYTRHLLSAVPVPDPTARRKPVTPFIRRALAIQPAGTQVSAAQYRQLAADHLVLDEAIT